MALLNDPTGKVMAAPPPVKPMTAVNVAEGPNRPPTYYTPGYDPRLPGTNGGVQYNPSLGYLQGQNGTGLGQYPTTNVGPSNFQGPQVSTQYDRNGQYIGPRVSTLQNPNAAPVYGGPTPGKGGQPAPANPVAPPPPTGTPPPPTGTTPPPTGTPPPPGQDFRDIFNFMPTAETDNMIMGHPELGQANRGQSTYINPGDENNWTPEQRAQVQRFQDAGIISRQMDSEGNYGDWNINYDKLPMAQVNGHAMSSQYFTPTDSTGSNLMNPDQRLNTSNYGEVSNSLNNNTYKPNKWGDLIYQWAPSLFMAGMGGAIASAAGAGSFAPMGQAGQMAWNAPRIAQGLGEGGNPAQILGNAAISYGSGALGLPAIAKPFLQYGLNELTRKPDPSRPGGG